MRGKFTDTLTLTVEGFNQARLVTTLSNESITIYKVDRASASKMEIEIRQKDAKKTFAIFEKMCYTYTVKQCHGIKTIALWWLKRIGLIIGLAIFIALTVFSRSFIWRIEIYGNENTPSAVIESKLKSVGLYVGSYKKNIDNKHAADELRSLNEVSEASVEVKGTSVIVRLLESTSYVPTKDEQPKDINSNYDAIVTKVVARRGTPVVKNGDIVKKGTKLIAGALYSGEGEIIKELRADGEVYGTVAVKESCITSLTGYSFERTGKNYITTSLNMLGLSSYVKKPPFVNYESETYPYTFEGLLPIKAIRTEYYETTMVERNYTIEERIEDFKNKSLDKNIFLSNNTITVKHVVSNIGGDLYKIDLYLEAEIIIGEL